MKLVTQHTKESSEKTVLQDDASELTTVSVVIPTYNEERFISECLDSVLANDHPKEKLEILIVDGMSLDGTRKIVRKYIDDHDNIRLIDNPKKITPVALNIGIGNSKGEIIIRMDAHATYPRDYISQCVYYLREFNADNVGSAMRTVSRTGTFIGKAIAYTISHPFGVGNSTFRVGTDKPKWVDTVFGGCFRREVFDRVGYFNENLSSSQDMEFNTRLRKSGGKILLVPAIVTDYYTRSDLCSFIRNNFRNGVWAVLPYKYTKKMLAFRHLVPMFFVIGIIIMIILSIMVPMLWYLTLFFAAIYGAVAFYYAVRLAIRIKEIRYAFLMPLMFFNLHLVYGLGSLIAALKIIKGKI